MGLRGPRLTLAASLGTVAVGGGRMRIAISNSPCGGSGSGGRDEDGPAFEDSGLIGTRS